MHSNKAILHNLGLLTVAQGTAHLLNLVALVYLARMVGSHWFGVLQIGATLSLYAVITAEWGLFTLGIRQVSRLKTGAEILGYARSHLGLLLGMAVPVFVIGLLLLPLFPAHREDYWILPLFLLMVFPQVFMLDWIALGLEQMGWAGTIKAVRSLFQAGLLLLLLGPIDGWLGWPAYRWVPVLFLVAYLVSNRIMAWRAGRWLGGTVLPAFPGWGEWRSRLAQATPIGASSLTARVLIGIDVILLGLLIDPSSVGIYCAAAKILGVIIIGGEVLWRAILPRFSRLWAESHHLFRQKFNTYFGVFAFGILPLGAGGLVLGDRVMVDLYGPDFATAGGVFRILSLSYVALSLGRFLSLTLVASDRQHAIFRPLLGSALVAVIGNLLLIPRLDMMGACWAMLAAHSLLFGWTMLICRKLFTVRLVVTVLLSVLAAGVTGVVVTLLPAWHSGTLVGIGALVYLVLGVPCLVRLRRD
ncbi:MAG: oligosaccharide flippase family protein [Candidatus Krumholzibacteriota bacterium]